MRRREMALAGDVSPASLATPLGAVTLFARPDTLIALSWGEAPAAAAPLPPVLEQALDHLDRYFAGVPLPDALPLEPAGTPYQQRVWRAIAAIPFAAVRSYADLARELSSGPRAIASACARNPLPLFIPCHRVVGSGGTLGGYSGGAGLATKRALLALEGTVLRHAG
ncbi:MAG: methylated-DNA--[protein]-cysteine S-methyltransferase [Rhodospirillales bacterium]